MRIKFCVGKPEGKKDYSKNWGVDGRIILKCKNWVGE
jgi:hypothetical protein